MTAFNAVRFRVKPGRDEDFLAAHREAEANWPGLQSAQIVKTGDRSYCIIAQWSDMDALAAARPQMIATLDSFRDTLRPWRRPGSHRPGVRACRADDALAPGAA